jgi:amino acid adenylation domain-containing protein
MQNKKNKHDKSHIESMGNNRLPLTEGQKGLWFLHQLEPLSDRYHMPLTFKVSQSISSVELEQILNIFVQRHAILGSTFHQSAAGQYRQINAVQTISLDVLDISELHAQDLLKKVRELSSQPFILDQGPLLRTFLLKRAGKDNILLLVFHHLVFDGASLKIMFDELEIISQSLQTGSEKLPVKTGDFNTFQVWQDQWLQSDEARLSHEFWLNKLQGELPQLPLEGTRNTVASEPVKGEFIKFNIPVATVQKFKQLATDNKCSEYLVWLLAYFSFLSAFTSQKDIIVGTASMGRPDAQFDDIVGYFVNLIPLRYQINSQQSFVSSLNQFKNEVFESLMHADYPLSEIINDLGVAEQRGDQPLFQTTFVWTVTEQLKAKSGSRLGLEIYPIVHESGEQNLSLEMLTADDTMSALLKYRSHCYTDDFIANMKNCFLNYIQSIANEADIEIGGLSLLSEADEDYLLHALNNNHLPYQQELGIHQLFEQQVKEKPAQVAIIHADQSLTYLELNNRANQLAHYLVEQGVKTEDLIGLCMRRSIDMLVALLAILKAGACYVPIDSSYPKKRINQIMDQSGLILLITQKHFSELTDNAQNQLLIDTEETRLRINSYPSTNLANLANLGQAHQLAYIIYTSGSTGQPKGVMLEHHSVINLAENLNLLLDKTDAGAWGWVAPLTFDASVQGICAMVTGQSLCIVCKQTKMDKALLTTLLSNHAISIIDCTPTLLEYWFGVGLAAILPDLVIGGEAISTELWAQLVQWQKKYNRKAYNVYGPTEACVDCSFTAITGDIANIGKPLNNVQFYVFDENEQLRPHGCTGELYVGGAGLARAYLNNKQLTTERFIQHPYSYDDNDILYKTGDLVRYLANDQLEFIGRIDEQVKIRGFRIELGDIQAQLESLSVIKSSLITVQQEDRGQFLLAYFSSDSLLEESELVDIIRKKLYESLPDYMMPSVFVRLDEFPLTANGKIDKKALPAASTEQLVAEYKPPSGEMANRLQSLWSKLLAIPAAQISGNDNFFKLGGHSLLVARLINDIKEQLGVEISYKDVFTYSSLQDLSTVIDNRNAALSLAQNLQEIDDDSLDELEW